MSKTLIALLLVGVFAVSAFAEAKAADDSVSSWGDDVELENMEDDAWKGDVEVELEQDYAPHRGQYNGGDQYYPRRPVYKVDYEYESFKNERCACQNWKGLFKSRKNVNAFGKEYLKKLVYNTLQETSYGGVALGTTVGFCGAAKRIGTYHPEEHEHEEGYNFRAPICCCCCETLAVFTRKTGSNSYEKMDHIGQMYLQVMGEDKKFLLIADAQGAIESDSEHPVRGVCVPCDCKSKVGGCHC